MASSAAQPLGYGSILAGALLLIAGVGGSTITSVAQGHPDHAHAATGAGGTPAPSSTAGSFQNVSGAPGAHGRGTAAEKTLIQGMSREQGWDPGAWETIIEMESGWDPGARNPKSGAFGIGQFNPSSGTLQAYQRYGSESHDPLRQIEAMAVYIKKRYGNPTAALAFHRAHGWY